MTLLVVILSGAKRSRRTPPHVERLASRAEKSSTGSLDSAEFTLSERSESNGLRSG
jgi:hypothetical protein